MNFRNKTKEIDGIKFTTVEFPAYEALKLQRKLLGIVAPSLGMLAGGMDLNKNAESILNKNINGDSISKAVLYILDQLNEQQFLLLVEQLLRNTQAVLIRGEGAEVQEQLVSLGDSEKFKDTFNIVFAGKPFTIYKVIGFVLGVNFPGFFDKGSGSGLLDKIAGLFNQESDT